MLMFTLAISCLMTSNLPWFMHLTFQVPLQYSSLQPWTLLPSPVTTTTRCCFCFVLASYTSGTIYPLFSGSMLGTYWPEKLIFQYRIVLPFHTVHGVLKEIILKWFAIPFSSRPHFVHHHHPEFAQIHVHWIGDAIQPSHPLLSPSPPAFTLSQHQGLF